MEEPSAEDRALRALGWTPQPGDLVWEMRVERKQIRGGPRHGEVATLPAGWVRCEFVRHPKRSLPRSRAHEGQPGRALVRTPTGGLRNVSTALLWPRGTGA